MKKSGMITALFLILMNHNVQAEDMNQKGQPAEGICQIMLNKCKTSSKNLNTAHPDACDMCMTHCKKAQAVCADEKAQANLQSASVHLLHCKHKCLNPSHSE